MGEIFEGDLVGMTVGVVAAYVTGNNLPANQLPGVIGTVHAALKAAAAGPNGPPRAESKLQPAVSIRRSVTPDEIRCLECGKPFKSLRRHLGREHAMSPEEYRAKWSLPRDYPMTAPTYAASRSALAKAIGLGQLRQRASVKAAPESTAPSPRNRPGSKAAAATRAPQGRS